MKPLVCIYCEGTELKAAVLSKENGKLKILRTASTDAVQSVVTTDDGLANLQLDTEDLQIDGLKKSTGPGIESTKSDSSSVAMMNDALSGINLNTAQFIPALTEPAIFYHVFEGSKFPKPAKVTQEIINDIQEAKNVSIDSENLGYIELADKSLLSVFLGGEVSCINFINSLARYNNKRYYKIATVKSAEISLAYYVSKRKKFFPDDNSLIVYIGKEYSKLIFLHGRKLKHIGTTLDIGTTNLHTYDVYFSKILLEMENGGISSLDNIIVCGEDDSENLILSFYGTFPEANVSRLEFDDLDLSAIDEETKSKFSSYSVPIAVGTEYIDELEEGTKGINLLPKRVKSDQKFIQFAWHGYLMLPLLFVATFFVTQSILKNHMEMGQLDQQITEQTILARQNQEMLKSISQLKSKIEGFDQTQAILDSAAVGTGVWTEVLQNISDFFAAKHNLWLTNLSVNGAKNIVLVGYAVRKSVVTQFAYSLEGATLKSMLFEALRDQNAYKFTISFSLLNNNKKSVANEQKN
jgi:hypothetical protein